MAKVKTSELIGSALDWAVAKCEWVEWTFLLATTAEITQDCKYSTNWAQGGPIKEKHQISTTYCSGGVEAIFNGHYGQGPTELIATMRCYVASKLGEFVDVPDELV